MPFEIPAGTLPRARGAPLGSTPQAAFGLLMAIVMGVTLSTAIVPGWTQAINLLGKHTMTTMIAMLIAMIMTGVPVCLCLVQGVARGRHLEELESLRGTPLADTLAYRYAQSHLAAVKPTNIGYDYVIPMLVFAIVVLFGCIAINCAFLENFFFDDINPVLGGPGAAIGGQAAEQYQRGTFIIGAYAFLGAYVYVLYGLLQRLNTDDIQPIIFYRYAAHMIIAYIVAGCLRHTADELDLHGANWLIPIAFVVGLSPDLFVKALSGKVFARLKIFGMRDDPGAETRPSALPLLMIDELKQSQIDRFSELGIQSSHDLSNKNPFLLEHRVPFELQQLVAWIAQAQMYVLVRDKGLAALRTLAVPDIFALHLRLSDPAARGPVCAAIGIPLEAVDALVLQLNNDPGFVQLQQVRDAMRQTAAPLLAPIPGAP